MAPNITANAPAIVPTADANLSAGISAISQIEPAMIAIAAAILRKPLNLSTAVVATCPPLRKKSPSPFRANDADLPTLDHLTANNATAPIRAVIAPPLKSILESLPQTLVISCPTVPSPSSTSFLRSLNIDLRLSTRPWKGPKLTLPSMSKPFLNFSIRSWKSFVKLPVKTSLKLLNATAKNWKLLGRSLSSGSLPFFWRDSKTVAISSGISLIASLNLRNRLVNDCQVLDFFAAL